MYYYFFLIDASNFRLIFIFKKLPQTNMQDYKM